MKKESKGFPGRIGFCTCCRYLLCAGPTAFHCLGATAIETLDDNNSTRYYRGYRLAPVPLFRPLKRLLAARSGRARYGDCRAGIGGKNPQNKAVGCMKLCIWQMPGIGCRASDARHPNSPETPSGKSTDCGFIDAFSRQRQCIGAALH